MPRPNIQPNTTTAASNANANHVIASNRTVNAFLGGPRPSWMLNTQATRASQPVVTQNHRKTKPQEPSSRTTHTQSQLQAAPPSSLVTAFSQDTVLPSPALTNESSPADTTQNPKSPNASAGATASLTSCQDSRQTEAVHTAAQGDIASSIHNAGATPALSSERLIGAQEIALQACPTDHGRDLGQRQIQSETLPAGSQLRGANSLGARFSADVEAQRAKRIRLEPAPTAPPHSEANDGRQPTMSQFWVQQMDKHLQQCGGLASLESDLDRLRYSYLRQACVSGDLNYVFLHRLLCQWTVQQSAAEQNLPDVPADTLREAMQLLQVILRSNQELTTEHLMWFATFPSERLDTAVHLRSEIEDFLTAFAQNWQLLLRSFSHRHVPLTVFELITLLKCKSRIIQGTLFTASRRTMDVPDNSTLMLNKLFSEDQASEERLAGNTGYTPVYKRAVRTQFVARYRMLIDRARGIPPAGEPGQQNPATHFPVVERMHSNSPLPQGLRASATSSIIPSQATVYPAPHSVSSLPAGGYNGVGGGGGGQRLPIPPLQHIGQQAGSQVVSSAPFASSHNVSQQAPAVSPDYMGDNPYSGHPVTAGAYPPLPSAPTPQAYAWSSGLRPQNPQHNYHGGIAVPVEPRHMPRGPQWPLVPSPHHGGQPTPSPISPQPPQLHSIYPPGVSLVPGQDQHRAVASQTSAASTTASTSPRRRSSVAGRQAAPQTDQSQIRPHEYPRSPYDWTSVLNGGHLPHLRSPKRRPMESAIPSSPHYQYLSGFAVKPTHLTPQSGLRKIEFTLSKEDVEKTSETSRELLTALPVCRYSEGSRRYRLRLCIRPEEDVEVGVRESAWAVTPTHWPAEFYPTINEKPLILPRKQYFRYDQAVDISNHIMQGTNVVKISFPKRSSNFQKDKTFFVAVEVVVTRRHDLVRSEVLLSESWSAVETAREIAKRLAPGDSDDVIVANNTLTISINDPFTSVMFDTPVRGRDCKHLECFDLDVWLSTREGKPSKVKGQEPSLVDNWGCPICGLDARPNSLRIDSYMAIARNELHAMGKGRTRQIVVHMDGRWEPVVDSDEGDDDSVVEAPVLANALIQGPRLATSNVVEILDD